MTWGMVAVAGAGLAGGLIASSGAKSAAGTQAEAANRSADLQKQMFDKQMELQEPYRAAGITGQNRLMELMGLGGNAGAAGYGKYAKDFGMADYQADPGYAFRLSEGLKGLDRSAAARGGLISGGALKAATQYGQEMGSQEYQNAFNRYQTNRTNQLQPLGNLMTSGQNAASNQGAAAGQYGTNVGSIYQTQGVNQGNALMAGNQARTSAYGDIAKLYGSTNPNLNSLFPSQSSTAEWT